MPVTDVQQDLDNLTLTITADFAAPVERIWQVYADPRQLEKVWGPPTYPATVIDHDLAPGGRTTYFMTGPDGDKHAGFWQIVAVDADLPLLVERLYGPIHYRILLHLGTYTRSSIRSLITETLGPLQGAAS